MLTNQELADFLRALVVLLLASHLLGSVFQKFRLPRVIGEIGGGFLFGPSVLGHVAPGLAHFLITTGITQEKLLSAIYWIGLTLLMFTAGFRVHSGIKTIDRRIVFTLAAADTVIPVVSGFTVAYLVGMTEYLGPHGSAVTIAIIFGIATAVTSLPVISRIFLDLGIIETDFAKNVLSAATLQDIFLWSLLAVATGLATGETVSPAGLAVVSARALTFCVLGLLIGPLLLRLAARLNFGELLKTARLGYMMAWCLLVVSVTTVFDINIIFGAFIAGIAFGGLRAEAMMPEKTQISAFSFGFFVPLYFAIVGYRIDLPNAFDLNLVIGFLVFSSVMGIACVWSAVRLIGVPGTVSWNYAVAMNTRGGPGIVLASVAFDFGIADQRVFVALVLAAIITSLLTGIWFRYLVDRDLPISGR